MVVDCLIKVISKVQLFFFFQTKEYTAVELMDVYKVRKFAFFHINYCDLRYMLHVIHGPALAHRICEFRAFTQFTRRVIQILFLLTTSRHFKKPVHVCNENKRSPQQGYFILISHYSCRDDKKINKDDLNHWRE